MPTRGRFALGALLLGACQPVVGASSDPGSSSGVGGSAGGAGGTTGAGVAGKVAIGAGGSPWGPEQVVCFPAASSTPLFEGQALSNQAPARRVLYSWTTPEHVDELRRDGQLFARSEQAGKGRGYAFDVIAGLAMTGGAPGVGALAQRFTTDLFPKVRSAWPRPWATRMGWPGEDHGNRLLRIVLKEAAWTAVVRDGDIRVLDSANQVVALADAVASPERIGALFFVKDPSSGGAGCDGAFSDGVTGATYREFIVGNEAMVEEWSLGTAEIQAQIAADVTALSAFLSWLRACPPAVGDWGATLACEWLASSSASHDAAAAYARALAFASDFYLPERWQIANLIDTLQSDPVEPEPLIVRPGE